MSIESDLARGFAEDVRYQMEGIDPPLAELAYHVAFSVATSQPEKPWEVLAAEVQRILDESAPEPAAPPWWWKRFRVMCQNRWPG